MLTAVYNANATMTDAVNACSVQPVALERGGAPVAVVLPYDIYDSISDIAEDFYLGQKALAAQARNDYISGPELIAEMKARLAEIDAMEARGEC